jgi:hypothetical protein
MNLWRRVAKYANRKLRRILALKSCEGSSIIGPVRKEPKLIVGWPRIGLDIVCGAMLLVSALGLIYVFTQA